MQNLGKNLNTIERALKECYLPAWQNQLGTEPSALLGKIKTVDLKSNKIVATAPIGLSGGFGFGAEGQATPASGNVMFERFETEARDMYVNVCISEKAVRLTGSGGSMANALDTEIKGAYETAKWNVGRALFGNGTGILANIEAVTGSNEVVIASTEELEASTDFLKEGLIVDFYPTRAEVGTTPVATRRIKSINRANKTFTVYGESLTVGAGFITVQNSYGREITGLGTIFDTTVDTIYGLKKADNPFLAPVVLSAEDDIRDGIITKALRQAQRDKNSNIDLLMAGDDAYDSYVEYLRTNNIRVEEMTHTIQGGFKAIKFIFNNREVDIVNESFVKGNEIWGVDTSALELHTQKWNFAELQNGGIFNLMDGQSAYRALLANYGDLICKNPGGCVRITDCSFARENN